MDNWNCWLILQRNEGQNYSDAEIVAWVFNANELEAWKHKLSRKKKDYTVLYMTHDWRTIAPNKTIKKRITKIYQH